MSIHSLLGGSDVGASRGNLGAVSYDRISDVLYISKRPGAYARSQEGPPGVIWRFDEKRGDIIGVTIIDFAYCSRPKLAEQLAFRFLISLKEAQDVLKSVGNE